jgi:hypothetical protein
MKTGVKEDVVKGAESKVSRPRISFEKKPHSNKIF